MGLFNWLSWQLERRTMERRIDSLVGDLDQAMREVTDLRRRLTKTGMLLQEAEVGAKRAAEEQDKLRTRLELAQSAAAYWENLARNEQRWIAELRRQARELTCVPEPAESELERKAWEIYASNTYSIKDSFKYAEEFLAERDSRRKRAEVTSEN